MNKTNPREVRFNKFRAWLRETTGDRCLRYANMDAPRIHVLKNEFSPSRDFGSLQAAIDHFAHLMTDAQDWR